MGHVSRRDHGNGVTVLTVDRPPANALDLALLEEIVAAVQPFAGDPPRALVLVAARLREAAAEDPLLETRRT